MHSPEERVMVNVLAAVIIQFVICTFPAAILSILYMNKRSYDPVAFSIFRAFANNMVSLKLFFRNQYKIVQTRQKWS